ncbi:hypothetical protein M8C21_000461, partial [Ambrosia artemisiifolia]
FNKFVDLFFTIVPDNSTASFEHVDHSNPLWWPETQHLRPRLFGSIFIFISCFKGNLCLGERPLDWQEGAEAGDGGRRRKRITYQWLEKHNEGNAVSFTMPLVKLFYMLKDFSVPSSSHVSKETSFLVNAHVDLEGMGRSEKLIGSSPSSWNQERKEARVEIEYGNILHIGGSRNI